MKIRKSRRIVLVCVAVVVLAGAAIGVYVATQGTPSGPGNQAGNGPGSKPATPLIRVSGNELVNSSGKPERLIGVDLSGSKFCLFKNKQPFPAPANSSTVTALQTWHVNAVRMTLNESCWLGTDDEPHEITSAQYRQTIETFVSLLNAAHIAVIITMFADTKSTSGTTNGTTKGTTKGTSARAKVTINADPMADFAEGPAFWTSAATAFRSYPDVIFDLYNEPQLIGWVCWKNGCTLHGVKYAGMQQLIDAVRNTGARQPLMLGGVDYAASLNEWLANEPTDPDHQLVASVHIYEAGSCHDAKCWNSTIGATAKKVPVVTGELGSKTCSTSFLQKFENWSDKHGVSYLAWAWLTGNCDSGGPLLANFTGTPTAYGSAFKDHVSTLYQAGGGVFAASSTKSRHH